jgi:hypothetical protein
MANGVTGTPKANQLLTVHTIVTAPTRRMQLHNREHLVVPAVMLVAGVLNDALVPAEELRPRDWHGVPVCLGHPCAPDGQAMSARDPDVLSVHGVGHVYRAALGAGQRQGHPVPSLTAELWIDTTLAQSLGSDTLATYHRLVRGEPTEVSTGFYSQAYPVEGDFYGTPYSSILFDIRPDHLALLPNAIGACSIQDGCGAPRLNQTTLTYETACSCADPTTCTCHEGASMPAPPSDSRMHRLWQVLHDFFVTTAAEDSVAVPVPPAAASAATALQETLLAQLLAEQGTEALPVTIHAVDPETRTCVYAIADTCYVRYWQEEDGVLSFASTPEVLDLTEPLPDAPAPDEEGSVLTDDEEEIPAMATEQKVPSLMVKTRANRLIANGDKTGWTEIDRARLEAMDEATLIRLESLPQAAPRPEPREGYRALAEALEDVDPEEREGLEDALTTYKRRKAQLIEVILANKQNPFVKEELQAMKAERLEKLVIMAGDELPETQTKPLVAQQYAGRRMPQLRVVQTEETEVPELPDTMGLIVAEQKRLGLR